MEDALLKVLRTVAPGTLLREGMENVLRAKTGGLLVISDSPEIMELAEDGFAINSDFTPSNLYELSKMDGAIIISEDVKKIIAANTQLIPNLSILSSETGIRHRTAERVAKQTGALVISISQRRSVITIFKGNIKYVLREPGVIITKANQAMQTLEKYKTVLSRVVINLSMLEFEEAVTLYDVAKAIQRTEMVLRVEKEINRYISELGTEGRLISMQLEELLANVAFEGRLIIRDYSAVSDKAPENIMGIIGTWPTEDLLDLALVARALGYPGGTGLLDQDVVPRGYRVLQKIPRLPLQVVENLVREFGSLRKVLRATIEELDAVEGIGTARARSIKEGLLRYRDQLNLERHV